jgi:serine/threonine protein kinase
MRETRFETAVETEELVGIELVAHIGAGGMGDVWLARTPTGERVAVKFPTLDPAHPTDLLRFRDEIETHAHIAHPHVVSILGSGRLGGRECFVMDYVDGVPLDQYVERTPSLGALPAMLIALQCLGALEALHGAGFLHRDIKPENVLVREDHNGLPYCVLIDLGIAKPFDGHPDHQRHQRTDEGRFIGTGGWCSPEQARPGTPLDVHSDIFSLGLLLAYLVEGRRFEFQFGLPYLGVLASGEPLPFPEPVRRSPLFPIIEKATAPAPADRFASATAMRGALLDVGAVGLPAPAAHARPTPPRGPLDLRGFGAAAPPRLLFAVAAVVSAVAARLAEPATTPIPAPQPPFEPASVVALIEARDLARDELDRAAQRALNHAAGRAHAARTATTIATATAETTNRLALAAADALDASPEPEPAPERRSARPRRQRGDRAERTAPDAAGTTPSSLTPYIPTQLRGERP